MKNFTRFQEQMMLIGEVHGRQISQPLLDLYWKVLEPFPDEQCEIAFKRVLLDGRFFPKPVDFLEVLQGKKENQATEAWLKVLNAVKRVGTYQSVSFDDKAIHSVIDVMGGWEQLCTMKTEDEKWKEKEFEKLYSVITSRPSDNHPQYLPGTVEMSNAVTGHHDRKIEIIAIGTKEIKPILLSGSEVGA